MTGVCVCVGCRWCGATGGGVQAQGTEASHTRYRGPLDCIRQSVKAEGLKVLFRGHSGTLLREIPGTAGFFGAYEFAIRVRRW